MSYDEHFFFHFTFNRIRVKIIRELAKAKNGSESMQLVFVCAPKI